MHLLNSILLLTCTKLKVEVTSEIIANMCSSYSARGREPIVVDAGDGKGYLSSRLALQYKFKVLGIDANSINTNGAMARLEKLEVIISGFYSKKKCIHFRFFFLSQKQWDSLERQYKNEQAGIIVEKTGRRKRRQITRNASAVNDDGVEQNTENYKAITHYITETTDFLQLLKENFDTINLTHPAICLSGLHTCGNLASSCLRTFRDSNQIAAVCNIGCCYNNLDEQFKHSSDDSLPEIRFRVYEGKIIPIESIETTKDTYGFPMSQFLIEKKYALGRNARMLSVQPIDRVVDFRENLHDNIFYRALFEVLIVDHYPQYKNAIHVGRIKKCDTFVDYVRKCSKRMTILNFDHLTDAELDDVFHKHLHHKNFLIIFFLMRLCLAPIIETVILLDRLLYLLEANHDEQSSIYLVKFFDSVVSPRCYGIVALK